MTEPRTEAELENDIRELRGAEPGELARRLVERGWTKAAAGPRDEGLADAARTLLHYIDTEFGINSNDPVVSALYEVLAERAALAKASE